MFHLEDFWAVTDRPYSTAPVMGLASLATSRKRLSFDVRQHDGRDTRCSQRRLNARAVTDNHDGQVLHVDVLLRHTDDIFFLHGENSGDVLLVVAVRQPL